MSVAVVTTIAAGLVVWAALVAADDWGRSTARHRLRPTRPPAWQLPPPAHRLITRLDRWRARRRRQQQVAPALESVAAGLRSGLSLRQAVAAVAAGDPIEAELRAVASAAERGLPLAEAVAGWVRTTSDPDTHLAGAALTVAAEIGGPAARALDTTAAGLRERRAVADEAVALATQARLSAVVLSVAPVAFVAFSATTDDRTGSFLFGSPIGWACLAIGVGLDALGAWWMQRLVRKVTAR